MGSEKAQERIRRPARCAVGAGPVTAGRERPVRAEARRRAKGCRPTKTFEARPERVVWHGQRAS